MSPLRKKILLLAAVTIAGIPAAALLLLIPLQDSLQDLHAQLLQERIAQEIARLQEQDLQTTQREYQRLQTTSEELRQFTVSEATVLDFISELESLAQQSGVGQDLQNFLAPVNGAAETSFLLALRGETTGLLAYLAGLQRLATYVTVDRLAFSRPVETGRDVELSLFVHLHWQ